MYKESENGLSRGNCEVERFDDPISIGLILLDRAYRYARDTGAPAWDFAVEEQELRRAGLTNSEYRWLLARGYVEHAREVTLHDSERRVFQPLGKNSFVEGTCFVLTETGARIAH